MIELENVTVRYGDRMVLDSLSMAISGTGCVAIQGASGIGKTTLLRVLAGLVLPQSGKVSGLGNRRVGVVFQEDRLLPWCTALENAAIAGDPQDAETYLSRLGLAGAENMFPPELSGGCAGASPLPVQWCFPMMCFCWTSRSTGLTLRAGCRLQTRFLRMRNF